MNRTITLLICTFIYFSSSGQSVISSTGSSFNTSTTELSWTIGELVTTTATTTNITLNQGFQQGNLNVSTLIELEESVALKAYPNPVKDILTIETTEENLKYQIVSISGDLIDSGEITSNKHTLNFSNSAKGVYFLVIDNQKTHKIIKH